MPTAARLVGAITMAISAVLVMFVFTIVYPELDRQLFSMAATAGFVGLLFGWATLGIKAADLELSTVAIGLRSGVSVFIWTQVVFAIRFMIDGMMGHAYYQPLTAVLQIPLKMIEYTSISADLRIVGAMVILSLVCGAMARRAHLRWDIPVT